MSSETGSSCSGTDQDNNAWKYGLAIMASVLSSAGSAGGMILQKWAHNEQQALAEDEKYGEAEGIICSPLWWLGCVVLVLVPLPFDLVALSLAPQSIIAPLVGVTLVMVQVIAPYILGEVVTREDWIATAIIVLGCTLSTSFGSHCSTDYTLDQMLSLFESTPLHYAEVWWVFTISVTYYLIMIKIPETYPNAANDEVEGYLSRKYMSICYAYLGGAFAANQNIAFKAVGELLEKTMGYGEDQWYRWECYVLIGAIIVFSYLQLTTMNKGLSMWKAVKNLPIYNVFYAIMSTTYGGIFYQEYEHLSITGAVMFPIGCMFIIAGITMLAMVAPDDSDPQLKKQRTAKVIPLEEEEAHQGPTMDTDGNRGAVDVPAAAAAETTPGQDEEGAGPLAALETAVPTIVPTMGGSPLPDLAGEKSPSQLTPISAKVGQLPPIDLPEGKKELASRYALQQGTTPE